MHLSRNATAQARHHSRARGILPALRDQACKPGRRAALFGATAAALAAAPIALAASASDTPPAPARAAGLQAAGGYPIRGGIHNPPYSAYYRTTGIFSNNGSWTTRTENNGNGGAIIAGCHAPSGGLPCLDSDNLSGGLAFTFNTSGNVGGEILLTNPNGAPFTTNAHGLARGLNANYLEGHHASEFMAANAVPANAANASSLGGQPASSYVTTGTLLFAAVGAGRSPGIASTRGATAVNRSEGASGVSYTVTFGSSEIASCSYTASPRGAALAGGALGAEPDAASKSSVIVNAPKEFEGGFYLQVVC
ncbi:MAG TPA: hypothetical protein VKU89_05785 [Solirubrobacteraceae bacterium]|nr:hypothetical protein [Solirubrobacteraceae bacterium]